MLEIISHMFVIWLLRQPNILVISFVAHSVNLSGLLSALSTLSNLPLLSLKVSTLSDNLSENRSHASGHNPLRLLCRIIEMQPPLKMNLLELMKTDTLVYQRIIVTGLTEIPLSSRLLRTFLLRMISALLTKICSRTKTRTHLLKDIKYYVYFSW